MLIADAVRTLKGPPPRTVGRSVREDLVMLLAGVGRKSGDTAEERGLKIMLYMVPEVHLNPDGHRIYQEIMEPRREVMRAVLRRGVSTGELRPDTDVELTILLLTGPVLPQQLLRWNPRLDEASLPERVVDAILSGIAAAHSPELGDNVGRG